MLTEADLIAKRATLRWLSKPHPEWTHQDLADALDMSGPWVNKWLQRLCQADPDDVMALHSRSRARHTPPVSIASQPAVVQRIREIRADPPENLQRVPGPEAILYYLHRDSALQRAGVRLPRSQTTIWKILRQAGCITQDHRRRPKPLESASQGRKFSSTSKMLAVCLLIPMASGSMWLRLPTLSRLSPRSGYTARSAAIAMRKSSSGWWPSFSASMACPACSPLTTTPAWSAALPDAISPPRWYVSLRLGVIPNVIPPHRPDKNAYVERFHRSLGQECLQVHRPGTLSEVSELTEAFLTHYNDQRPTQARSCGNQPPRVACSAFPRLPTVPQTVDPDRWLVQINKRAFARTIRAGGDLTINRRRLRCEPNLRWHRVTCWVNAAEKRFEIWQPGRLKKSLPIKGLPGKRMPFEDYVELMKREARSEYQQYLRTHPRLTQGHFWA